MLTCRLRVRVLEGKGFGVESCGHGFVPLNCGASNSSLRKKGGTYEVSPKQSQVSSDNVLILQRKRDLGGVSAFYSRGSRTTQVRRREGPGGSKPSLSKRGVAQRNRDLQSSFGLESSPRVEDESSSSSPSLEELLNRVGAGPSRNIDGRVQIEANPDPLLLKNLSLELTDAEQRKNKERSRALPIPMPHKLRRSLPLPSRPNTFPRTLNNVFPSAPSSNSMRSIANLPSDYSVSKVFENWGESSKRSSLVKVILEVGRRNHLERALQVYGWVQQQPYLWPDEMLVFVMIQVAVENRELEVAAQLRATHGALSARSSRALGRVYANCGFVKEAMELLQLGAEGSADDPHGYAKLISIASCARAKIFVQLLLKSRELKLQLEDCTAVMAACSKLGLMEEVETLFQQYKGAGFQPNIVMYTTIMKARSRAGKDREAMGLLWEMEEAGCKPDLVAYRVIVNLCGKLGDLSKAVKLYRHIKDAGVSPTPDVYNTLIQLYCKEGRKAKAMEVLREMEMRGYAPTATTRVYLSASFIV